MSKVKVSIAVSLDGFAAGPNQSLENPLGEGGERLHEWLFPLEAFRRVHGGEGGEVNASTPVVEEMMDAGAFLMGRGCSAAAQGRGTSRGAAGGATIRHFMRRSSS